MDTNPYEPPQSNVETGTLKGGSAVKAVIIALIVDYGGSFILSAAIGIIYTVILLSSGMSPEKLPVYLENNYKFSPIYFLTMMLGMSMTVLAAYLCARITRKPNYKAVTVYLAILIIFGKSVSFLSGDDILTFESILLTIVNILAGYFGAWIYIRKLK